MRKFTKEIENQVQKLIIKRSETSTELTLSEKLINLKNFGKP